MARITTLAAVLSAAVLAAPSLASAQPTSIADGVYTVAQAERGMNAYRSRCQRCHGAELISTDKEAPNLAGAAFDATWVGETLKTRYQRIRYTMPYDNPDSLPPQTYADILAFVLSVNEVPAGDNELTADAEWLDDVTIERVE